MSSNTSFDLNESTQQKDIIQLEETIANCQRVLALEPDNAETYYQLAQAYYTQDKLEEAIAAYSRVIELNSNYAMAHHSLGDALTKVGRLEEAIASYSKAIELDPDFSWSHNNLADILKRQERWEEAVVSYRRAIELNPDFTWSYYNLGEVLSQQQQWEVAAIAYRHALEIQPEFVSYQKLGYSLAKQNKFDEAITCYQKAIELNPNDSELYSLLGEAMGNQGNYDEAIFCYRHSLELDPESQEVHNYLWTIVNQRKSWEEAALWYNQILEKQPGSALTCYYLGTALFNLDNWEESAAICRRGIELQAGYFWSHWLLGSALTKLEKWEEVAAAYTHAAQINPSFDLIYYYLGDALRKLSKWQEAAVAYHRCLQLNANNITGYVGLGECLIQLEQFDEAIACYQRILELQPEQTEENSQLETLMLQKGLMEPLLTCYHQAFALTGNSQLYYRLSLLLARQGLLYEAIAYFQKSSQTLPPEVDYETIWKYLNQTEWVDRKEPDCSTEIKWEAAEVYFNKTSQYKVVSLRSLSEADKNFLEKAGFSVFNLELIGQDHLALEEIYINSFGNCPPLKLSKKSPKMTLKEIGIQWETEANFSRQQNFQQSLIETGYMYALCPSTGKILRSNQSFYIDGSIPIIVYRFVGEEVFYLKCGHVHGGKMSIYFPRLELVVVLPSTTRDWGSLADNDVLLFNRFKAWLVSNWQQVKSYLSNDRPKKVASVLGTVRNMGHDFWNLLTGIHHLYENEILHKVDKFLVGPFDHVSIGDVFPEIPRDNIVDFDNPWDLFKYILENNYVAVLASGFYLKEDLARKMHLGAQARCSPDCLQTVEKAKKHFPLLWFEIRISNSRVWLSQIEGIANIINSLYTDFPNLGVVFAGWHRLARDYGGADGAIAREESVRQQILDLIPPDIQTYSTIGRPMYEALVWVNAIDVHITPLGSGAILPLNIANKIGVCYSNPNNLSNKIGLDLIYWRENMHQPKLISANSAVYDESAYSCGQPQVNWPFHCDWKAIYNELIKILEHLDKSP